MACINRRYKPPGLTDGARKGMILPSDHKKKRQI